MPRLTALEEDGADHPFVKGLTQQPAGLESQEARRNERKEQSERYLLGGGSFAKEQPQPPTTEPGSLSIPTEQPRSTTTPAPELLNKLSEVVNPL